MTIVFAGFCSASRQTMNAASSTFGLHLRLPTFTSLCAVIRFNTLVRRDDVPRFHL